MKRITDKEFLETTPDMDSIVAIRVENGKFYFHAWMSQYIGLLDGHTECNIQYAYNPFTCNIAREDLIQNDIFEAIRYSDWMKFSNERGDVHYVEDAKREDGSRMNSYETLLSLIQDCTGNKGVICAGHNILELTNEEIVSLYGLLCDGDYVFFVKD